MALTFREAQEEVDAWISSFREGYFPPLLMLARLAEELGELARVLAHRHGKTPKPGEAEGDLAEELGDLLFVLISLANREGWTSRPPSAGSWPSTGPGTARAGPLRMAARALLLALGVAWLSRP